MFVVIATMGVVPVLYNTEHGCGKVTPLKPFFHGIIASFL
jgi:hypothetical protein